MNHTMMSPAAVGALRRPGWADRLAVRLIERQLATLREGRLTVSGPFGTRTFGGGGDLAATITVREVAAYRRVLTGGTLAAARSYVRGDWTTDDLPSVCRIFTRNMETAYRLEGGWARLSEPWLRAARWLRRNTRRGSRRNIQAHYDLGNDFFQLFLDDTLSYSCGIFERADASLHGASVAKMDRICRKLDLRPDDHLLEIGSGWGGLAMHAAARFGCRVTTATISSEQRALALERVRAAGLADRVTVLLADYRDLGGCYDKLVSVEMIEAVGAAFLDTFFAQCGRLLAPGGRMVLQAITVPDDRYARYLGSVDFIEQDVFPGSCLVSVGAMRAAASRTTRLQPGAVEDLTPHYAATLRCWRERFLDRLDQVRRLGYSDEFIRRWEFYLCACEAGFAERSTGLVQIEFAQPGPAAPPAGAPRA
jgi:cyclopropane-fatty-acyl-phospholipid synthase